MPLLIEIDFDALRKFNYNFFHRISAVFQHTHGAYAVDVTRLGQEDGERLTEFVRDINKQREMKEAERQRKIDAAKEVEAAEQKRKADAGKQAEAEATERQRKIKADRQAGERRLLQYVSEQNLADTIENSKVIAKWLDENTHSYVSPANIDAAIKILGPRGTNVLMWKPKVAPAPPAPTPPPIRYLDTGEPELPLDAGEVQMRAASVAQLKDLSKRRGEGRQTWRKGWTGANL
jgi:hypothetical protein